MVHLTLYNDANESTILDLREAEQIYLNKQFADITNFQVQGGYSRDFRVPMTEHNQAFFGAIFNPNVTSFDFKRKTKATIDVDTLPIAQGHVQVKRIYSKGDRWHEIEVVFYSTTPNLSATIGDKKLSDLTNISDLDVEMTYANVTTGDDILKWGLTDRGQKWSEDAAEFPTARPVFSVDNPIYAGDLTPMVNFKWIWQQIWTDAGFTYGNATEIDGILEDYWMPFIFSQEVRTTETFDSVYFKCEWQDMDELTGSNAYDLGIFPMAEIADNGSNLDASFIFTAPFVAQFQFGVTLNYNISSSPSVTLPQIRLVDADTGATLWAQNVNDYDTATLFSFTPTILLTEGQRVKLRLANVSPASSYEIGLQTGYRLIGFSQPLAGATFNTAANAPDYKQIDFIRDVIKMHNLAFIPNENEPNNIFVQPLSEYIGSGSSADWSNKLDVSKDVVLYAPIDEQKKDFTWTYKAGGEYLSDIFVKQGGRVYGDYKLTDTGNEFATGSESVQLELCSTPCNEISNTDIPIPKFIDVNGKFITPNARCLYLSDTRSLAIYDEVTDAGILTNMPIFTHYDEFNPSVTSHDLNFAPETPLQQTDGIPYYNLWNKYWRRYYNELYSDDSRIMEAYFILSINDFRSIDFDDVIWIRDSYWRLLEIESFIVGVEGVSTKCRLAKLIEIPTACGFTPNAVTVNGQVLFTDGVDTGLDGSEVCCTLYGYSWNSDTSKCYAFVNGSGRPSQVAVGGTQDNTAQVQTGSQNTVEDGATDSIAVGTRNTVREAASTSLVAGTYVEARERGVHFGAGDELGRAQGGLLTLSGSGTYTVTGDKIEITNLGERINLEDGTTWLCELSIVMTQNASTKHSAVFTFHIFKNTTAQVSAVNTVTQVGSLNIIGASIDVTTNTAQHRVQVGMTGGLGYPYRVDITGVLKYTQVK